jgi:hypothetical protein
MGVDLIKRVIRLVGEVFEVRTQVERDLTTVSRVDRLLGLNKNLGRHKHRLPLNPEKIPPTGSRTHDLRCYRDSL